MAAEYEVNIKINSQQITRQLEDIDKAISKIGKSRGGGSSGKSGISSLSPTRQDLKASADYQKALQGVLKAGRDAEKVFGNLRKTAQSAMVAGANEARQLAAAAAGAPLRSQIGIRPTNVTRASADAAARQLEAQVRASAALEKQLAQEVSAFEMRADKRVLQAGLANDKIEFQQKIDDIIKTTDFAIRESKREGRAFDQELKRRGEVQQKAQRTRRKRLEGVALGAGFPLLFGGGAGSVLGGGLGGLTRSFGAQIALSALGQQVDKFVAGMVDAGKALTSVGGAADFMAEKSLFSSDAMQFRIEKLIEEGRVTEAAALMTQEMAKQVGGSGLKALKDLGTEASEMGKIFGTVLLRVQAFIAQGLTPLIKLINSAIGGMVAQNQLDQMLAEAESPQQRAAMLARSIELRGTKKQGNTLTRGDFTMEMLQTLQSEFAPVIPEGAAIEPSTLETLSTADSRAGDVAKDQQRLAEIVRRSQERLQIMQQEGDLAKELKKLDFERAAEIEKINKLENVGLKEREDAVQATNDLFDARKGEAIGKLLGKDLQTAIALKKAQDDVLRPLKDQKRLLEAKLKGNEKEVRLQLEIESIMRSVEGLREEDVENLVKGNALLAEQVAVAERLDQVYAAIGQSITTGIVGALTEAVEGTKSLAEVAGETLRQVGNILLQFGVQSTLSGVPGLDKFFPGRALGGSVSANKPYMVGERGPELFVPGAQGNVVPNNAIGGANVVVNVDASGSQAQGNQPNAKALGTAIGAAVQAELVKQKRPGGLLS